MEDLRAQRTLEADSRIENLMELLGVAADFKAEYGAVTLEDFLERVSLVSDTDELEREGGYVSLMTLHNAKGLEFPLVFIVGMEEGVFPHVRSMEDETGIEEERRLCYVGMTRAREALHLTHAETRSLWGGLSVNPTSRFLLEIPGTYLEDVEREAPGEAEKSAVGLEVAEGDQVVHAKWGKGEVLRVLELEGDCEIVVEFPGAGKKKLLLSFAPLSKPGE